MQIENLRTQFVTSAGTVQAVGGISYSVDELCEIGYQMAIFPATGFLAMGHALDSVYRHIHQQGSSKGVATPLYDFNAFSELMGFPAVWEFERRWTEPE